MAKRISVVRQTVSLYEAKTKLSELVERAARGEEIVISKSGKPRAVLTRVPDTRAERIPGRGRGKWRVKRSFDAPLPNDVLGDFER
jgi:prevent-host-death family protein